MTQQPTSVAAYQAIQPVVPNLRERIFDFLSQQVDGATDQEIQKALSIGPQTESPRRRELVQSGRVVDSGIRRPTTSNKSAIVWKAL